MEGGKDVTIYKKLTKMKINKYIAVRKLITGQKICVLEDAKATAGRKGQKRQEEKEKRRNYENIISNSLGNRRSMKKKDKCK